jgi:uncharacterized protein YqgC (DUF456 family)
LTHLFEKSNAWRLAQRRFDARSKEEAVLSLTIIILGLLVALVGIIGCVLPFIPGPPLSFLALIMLSFARAWEPFSPVFLFIMGGLAALVAFLDYVIPAGGAKKYGASKLGIWGSVVGMIIGIFVFPPWGVFLGGIAGALAGELFAGKGGREALRAGWGVFLGNVLSTGLKLAYCGVVLFFYLKEMF